MFYSHSSLHIWYIELQKMSLDTSEILKINQTHYIVGTISKCSKYMLEAEIMKHRAGKRNTLSSHIIVI